MDKNQKTVPPASKPVQRKIWMDNIRWITVMIVVFYHVIYIFNSSNVMGAVGHFHDVQYQDGVMLFVYPWMIMLLFAVSGISTRYALDKYSSKDFFRSRTHKLLVPSTLGVLIYQWIQGCINTLVADGFNQIPPEVPQPVRVIIGYIFSILFGTGPLWFIQLLWVFSLLILLIRKIDKKDKLYSLTSTVSPVIVMVLGYGLILGSAQILNMPLIEVFRFGVYFMAFLIGYFCLSAEKMQNMLEKLALPLGIAAVAVGIAYVIFHFGKNCADPKLLKSIFTNVYAWTAIMAIIGCGKKFLNRKSKFTDWMAAKSWGFYVLHYIPLLATAYLLYNFTSVPPVLIYIITAIVTCAASVLLFELFRRIPFLRWCILGIRSPKKQ